jgi:epoxide hydrolase
MAGEPPIEPFDVDVADDDLEDVRRRLAGTRWPSPAPEPGWEQGTDLAYVRELVGYWLEGFDWRTQERRLNQLDHFVTEVDGQRVHFVHARSRHTQALPLVLSHGWPGSIVEFLDVFGPLTDPLDPSDAFHVVAPSLSTPPVSGLIDIECRAVKGRPPVVRGRGVPPRSRLWGAVRALDRHVH